MNSSRKFSRSQRLIVAVAVGVTLWVGGCGDFLGEKSVTYQSKSIISDLNKVRTAPEPNIPLPQIYKSPPEIKQEVVGGAPEWRLYYFCQHHTSNELRTIVHDQFATMLFSAKGKSTALKDYKVSSLPATNQLIVRCPLKEDVEAVLAFLERVDIPPIQVKIDCIISEVYADKTLDWSTTIEILNLFGEDIALKPSGMPFIDELQILVEEGVEVVPAFPGAVLRDVARAKMGLKAGYMEAEHFTALVDILESQGYLKILMNPTLETVNGKMAKISSTQKVPLQRITRESPEIRYLTTEFQYVEVVDSLKVTPHVFADGSIGLETDIVLGSKLTPEGVKQISIVTIKEIENTENRIRPGESLIIGGLRKSEKRDVVRGVPFLKDIPGIGILFSGKDFEERAVETVFILTPTISTGGIPRKEIEKELKRKHETDKKQRDKILEAEEARLEAEAKKAEARAAVREADEQVRRAKAEAQKATTKVEEATAAEQQAKTEAEKAKAEAKTATEKATAAEKQAQAQIEKLKAETEKLKADTEKAKAETKTATEKAVAAGKQAQAQIEKLKAETEKLKADTEKAKADAQRATAEAKKAKADAEKATAEAEIAKADAEKVKAEAEIAKADAEKAMAEAEAKAEAAEKAKAEAEAKAEAAEKARAEAERPEQEGEAKDKPEAQKLKAEAEKLKAEAEKAKANAQRLMAEAEKAKAEAKTKAKAAKKAKAEADAKAEAEKPEEEVAKKARSKRDKADTQRRQRNKQKQSKRKPKRPKKDNKTNALSG